MSDPKNQPEKPDAQPQTIPVETETTTTTRPVQPDKSDDQGDSDR